MTIEPAEVRLISWNAERAAELAGELEQAGYLVHAGPFDQAALKVIAKKPPAAFVIDHGRQPAQARDLGIILRTRVNSRRVPLVFVDGAEEKIERTREVLPDAVFCVRLQMADAVRKAIADPPPDPVVPASAFAGYSGTPLPKKLGIKDGSTVAMVSAPEDFETTLGRLPGGVTVTRNASPDAAVTLWFLDSLQTLRDGVRSMADIAGDGRLWVCWPKKASGIATDVTQNEVRSTGLAAGIVDFKICAIDATWSGLCFTRRKKK